MLVQTPKKIVSRGWLESGRFGLDLVSSEFRFLSQIRMIDAAVTKKPQ
jgi:hypothetical protein